MKNRLLEIDALRGLAAVVVAFVFHQHYLTGQFQSGPLDGLPVFSALHKYGWVAVDLFFVISGYIFAYIYADDKGGSLSGSRFFVARFARLYPLHLATLLVCAGILAVGTPASAQYVKSGLWNFLLNLFMLQESGLQTGPSFNVPSWSISVEVVCYIIFYFIITRFPSRVIQISACLSFVGLIVTIGTDPSVDHIGRGLCGFFAGVVLFRTQDVARIRTLFVCLICASLTLLVPQANLGARLGFAFFPALVFLSLHSSILRLSALSWLGDRSYSIYMWHIPIYMAFNVLVFDAKPIETGLVWPMIFSAWLAILIISDLSYRLVETPARIWLNTLTIRSVPPLNASP